MALYHPTFILGIIILLYLSSFVLFAILRITTGISIQRIGYFSLRRIAYTLRDGVKIEIRALGIALHRPTFAQPTWLSLRVDELQVTVDPEALNNHGVEADSDTEHTPEHKDGDQVAPEPRRERSPMEPRRSEIWKSMAELKDKIKRIHQKIHWLRLLDVIVNNSAFSVLGVGQVHVGNFTIAVDVRRKVVNRSRLFHYQKLAKNSPRPAEWTFTLRSAFFKPENEESLEIIDQASLSVHGFLHQDLKGLRDATVAVKCGRLCIPYDHIIACAQGFSSRTQGGPNGKPSYIPRLNLTDVMNELDLPGTREESLLQAVSDSKEFASSILRGIEEIQVAMSFVRLRMRMRDIRPAGRPMTLSASMKEVAMDLHRLDPKSPAHRMYFPSTDISHEALLAGIGFSIDVGYGNETPERLVHVPMATATIKTTLPSKTFDGPEHKSAADRNANILFANIVITSPSLDMDPRHLPVLLSLAVPAVPKPQRRRAFSRSRHRLISRLLPKANIKLSVHEPVIRVALPPMESDKSEADDYDLLISSVSSVAIDLESFHSPVGEFHYSLACNVRITSHQLYYQTALRIRHDLLMAESLELKFQVSANPAISVLASGDFQTFSAHLVRPDISSGLGRIIHQLRLGVKRSNSDVQLPHMRRNFLRSIPSWLLHFDLKGSNFSVEVAGVDQEVSAKTRGLALQLESWSAEYKSHKTEAAEPRHPRQRTGRRSLKPEDALREPSRASPAPRTQNHRDGRRLAIHIRELEGFVIDSADTWEPEAFLNLPRFELAFSTSTDAQGPVMHIQSYFKTLLLNYNLYRYYCIGIAVVVLKNVFLATHHKQPVPVGQEDEFESSTHIPHILADEDLVSSPVSAPELVTIDVRAALVQVKACLPSEPDMMLQIYSLDVGNHRWTSRHFKAELIRVLVKAPKIPRIWARIVCVKHLRCELREIRKKSGLILQHERSIEITADAVRLAVPHQLILYKVFDNVVNAAKATQQLHYRFKTGRDDYILNKKPESPKLLPRISFRTKGLLVELEDGPFDRKLAMIYRVGLVEMGQRLAREEAFSAKVNRLREARQKRAQARSYTRLANLRKMSKISPISESDHQEEALPPEASSASAKASAECHSKLRYDREGKCGLGDSANISIDEAWARLQELNARSWKKRIDWGLQFQRETMKAIRDKFWDEDELPEGAEETETILEYPRRPALLAAMISDLRVIVDKPSFPLQEYASFLHRIGKGMPYDMKYSMLVPVSLQIDMGETRMTLRDYPLPLLHIPPIRPTQPPRLPSWSLRTDFVIAEEFRDAESTRSVNVIVVPAEKAVSDEASKGFAVDVRRTVSPVKTYSDANIEVHTGYPTQIAWATSYQPAIQEMMMVFETFTKPPVDPSEQPGFWDKIRLGFHSRVNVAWTGDGDVHLLLKGSRDPYVVTGYGAGFIMCWRSDVRWRICQDLDPRKFMTVDSGEYVLAIPDYSHQARHSMDTAIRHTDTMSTTSSFRSGALFKKVIMKLTGNVQWLAGLVFERKTSGGGRTFDFMPHYNVVLKTPNHAKASGEEKYDALRGFRSHYIHLSVAVAAPVNRAWSVSNLKPSTNYNSVHLTPRFFTHFFNWWSLFSGSMALPIRQGPLWPGVEKTKKKFSRHLATIQYNLLLSPLFISHIYKHKDAEDYHEDMVSATGLKVKLDSFMIDLHQRREKILTTLKGRKSTIKATSMRINQAQVDFISADIRAVSASIAGTTVEDLRKASGEALASIQQVDNSIDLSRFTIPDNDFSWIDMDDFVELDWVLPAESNPETKIMPLAFAPRFTYFRQTDDRGPASPGAMDGSRAGDTTTHFCVMSPDNDPRLIQCDIIRERLVRLQTQMEEHQKVLVRAELDLFRDASGNETLRREIGLLKHHGSILEKQKRHLHAMLEATSSQRQMNGHLAPPNTGHGSAGHHADSGSSDTQSETLETAPLTEFASTFQDRFIVHNVQLKWNNTLRNIILRYIHQVSQRRGFVYYLSRRAVKFILDIVEEQTKPNDGSSSKSRGASVTPNPTSLGDEGIDLTLEDRIEQLLRDAKKFVNANDPPGSEGTPGPAQDRLEEQLAQDFAFQDAYHVRLIAPQIQLQSEKNTKAAVLVTAKGMQLKVIQVMDRSHMTDDVSGLVQRRFLVDMNSVQVFVTDRDVYAAQFIPLFSGNPYGAAGNESWPPWVPLELMMDFHIDPFGFSRVVQRTSASLRYDKYNTLRLRVNEEVNTEQHHVARTAAGIGSQVDQVTVQFPRVRAVCDSSQYYALYIIVLDLLLYNEPLEKVRSERLERIMLASDFSDLRGAPELVMRLQERIRQLEEIKLRFQVDAKYLDRQGWEDRLAIEQDLAACEDELFFMLKAIMTAQRRIEDRTEANGVLRWNISALEIVWQLMKAQHEPLIELQLTDATYDRMDHSDGSNFNTMLIDRIRGYNLLPDATYPEMIAPYIDQARPAVGDNNEKMLRVQWHMLEAIAGIPVMDSFEVNLFPLRIQLEREVGKRLFEYIFPGNGTGLSLGAVLDSGRTSTLPADRQQTASSSGKSSRSSTENSTVPEIRLDSGENGDGSVGQHSLMLRLRPTTASDQARPRPRLDTGSRPSTTSVTKNSDSSHAFRFFHSSQRPRPSSRGPTLSGLRTKRSVESLRMTPLRPGDDASPNSAVASSMHSAASSEHSQRFSLRRVAHRGNDSKGKKQPQQQQQQRPADELTEMMMRAQNYMTLAYVKITSVVLCLSYQGRGERNIEDLHDFVFRMPVVEYRNKTWSNLDLALRLKRDVVRALISHTGALIGNKLAHHRVHRPPAAAAKAQHSRAREAAAMDQSASSIVETSTASDASSLRRESSPGGGAGRADGGDDGDVDEHNGDRTIAVARAGDHDNNSHTAVSTQHGSTADEAASSAIWRTPSYASSSVWSSATKGSHSEAGPAGQSAPAGGASSGTVNPTAVPSESQAHEENHHGSFIHNTLSLAGRRLNHLAAMPGKIHNHHNHHNHDHRADTQGTAAPASEDSEDGRRRRTTGPGSSRLSLSRKFLPSI